MTRLEQIYCMALDIACEDFENEITELVKHRRSKLFNHVVTSIMDKMLDDKITTVDVTTFKFKIYYQISKSVNDAIYMKKFLINIA